MGGLWGIDMASQALRCTNQLSFASYSGTISVVVQDIRTANPLGGGLIAGWSSGGTFGTDASSSNPYSNSEGLIETDLVPIGTYNKPRNMARVEYKLRKPMVAGESIVIKSRLDPTASYGTLMVDSTVGNYSSNGSIDISNAQWLQFKIITSSTASSPSYVPVKEIRITGLGQ